MADLEDAFLEETPFAPRGGADDNIQVLVRVRPPNARELEQVRAYGDSNRFPPLPRTFDRPRTDGRTGTETRVRSHRANP